MNSMKFAEKIKSLQVKPNTVSIFWIGQAGFAMKTEKGKIILLDPYLTDSVHHELSAEYGWGFKRLAPALFEPEELQPDYLLLSHEHGDHCDTEAVRELSSPDNTICVCNRTTEKILQDLQVETRKTLCAEVGMKIELPDLSIEIVKADHGPGCPGALGFMLTLGTAKIYYSGDTCFNEEVADTVRAMHPDVALLPINGAFGNLDGKQAADFAAAVGAKVCIPHHFWTFPQHYGDPMSAIEAFQAHPECELRLLTPGEEYQWKE